MNDQDESYFGKSFVIRRKAFLYSLDQIQKKYNDWFIARRKDSSVHDYYILSYTKIGTMISTSFCFRNNSDLPEVIQKECQRTFEIFFPKNI